MADTFNMDAKAFDESIGGLIAELGGSEKLACIEMRDGGREHNCIRLACELPARRGHTQFWYGSDCKKAQEILCSACLAYWHLCVARNLILRLAKLGMAK